MKRVAVAESGPLYQYIEFCRNAETLWHKLQSGHWDWLGRKPDGQFVLGRPRRIPPSGVGVPFMTKSEAEATEGLHGIQMQAWVGQPSTQKSSTWVTTADKAKTEFEKEIARLEDAALKPVLAWVYLVQDGQVTDERLVVQKPPPNYR
jgi:hypothetical protein